MLKINNERKEEEVFGRLEVGDVFIDPDDNDVCLKVTDGEGFSFENQTTFPMDYREAIIPVHEAILTIR